MPRPKPDFTTDREMYKLRESGLSLDAIGKRFPNKDGKPLTRERVRQRLDRYEEHQIYQEVYSLFDHDTKMCHVLLSCGITSIKKLLKYDLEKMERKKGCGKKMLAKVKEIIEKVK